TGAGVHSRQADVGGYRAARSELAGNDRSVGRPQIGRTEGPVEARLGEVAGQHVVVRRAMIGIAMPKRTDERERVKMLRQDRQVLAETDAGNIRSDRLKR